MSMTMAHLAEVQAAAAQRASRQLGREAYRVRLTKVLLGLAIGVCFWFSVPYELPFSVPKNLAEAASNASDRYAGSLSRQIAMPVIALIATYLLWRLPKRGKLGGPLLGAVAMYVGWALISVAWSQDPATTLKRLVVFAIDVYFAYTVARVFSVLEMALLGFTASGVVALISVYSQVVLLKEFAPLDSDFRFMGTMTANYQAMSLVVCLVCALTLMERKPAWAKWLWMAVAVALGLLFLTRSRVSTILCFGILLVMVTRMARTRMTVQGRAMLMMAIVAVGLPGVIYAVGRNGLDAAQTVFMMGRNDSENTANLSNRAPLWAELWESVEERPLQGVGYAAFWTPARVAKVSADQGWAVPHAHNSYLDQTLSLGAVGAVLYAVFLWGATAIAWKRYRRLKSGVNLFPAILLTWIALEGLAENAPLDPYLPTMLVYACVVKMCLTEGTEAESDVGLGEHEILGGLPPEALAA